MTDRRTVTRPLRRPPGAAAGDAAPSAAVILAKKLIAHDAVAELDRGGKAFGVGAAVALDDDAVEAEKHPAIGAARIHALAQPTERRAGEQIADPRAERAAHCAP